MTRTKTTGASILYSVNINTFAPKCIWSPILTTESFPAGYFIIKPYRIKAKASPTKPVTNGPHGVIGPIIKLSILSPINY